MATRQSNKIDRFLKLVGERNEQGCYEWKGSKNKKGYGLFCDKINGRKKKIKAHRVSYEFFIGSIKDRLFVLHECDNPSCVNPFHLFLGTNRDNMDDKIKKGRQHKGEKTGGSILTTEKVLDIRYKYSLGGVTMKNLAEKHGVHFVTISDVINRKTWNHV